MDDSVGRVAGPVPASLPANNTRDTKTMVEAVPSTVASAVVQKPARSAVYEDSGEAMAAIAARLQDYLRSSQRDIEFSVDVDTKTQVVVVRDASGEVVRQMPSEEVLRVLRNLHGGTGALFETTV